MGFKNRLHFQKAVLEEISSELAGNQRDEMAIPSYLHGNPLISWLVSKRMRCAISALELGGNESLLDFGCGTGMLFLQLPPSQGRYYGVDLILWPAKKILEMHQRSDVQLISVNNWQNEISDHSLDRITAIEVLEHVDDVASLGHQFRRKLKSDGLLVIAGPTENRFYRLCRKIAGFTGEYHHRNISNIRRQIENTGFTEKKRINLPLPGPLGLFVVLSYRIHEGSLPVA